MSATHRLLLPLLLAALAPLTVAACSKTDEPPPGAVPPSRSAETSKPAPAPKPGADITWDAPPSFIKADNPSPMRKATYKVIHAEGDSEDGDLSISSAGGTVELNVARWKAQFEKSGEPNLENRKVGDLDVTVVGLEGTFSGGMPGAAPSAPKPGFALLGAIVKTPGGLFFFKLTGPRKTIVGVRPDFDKLIASVRLR
ncbi:MAG: hypothetical protein U0359_06535 [Byssovorax sp.]